MCGQETTDAVFDSQAIARKMPSQKLESVLCSC